MPQDEFPVRHQYHNRKKKKYQPYLQTQNHNDYKIYKYILVFLCLHEIRVPVSIKYYDYVRNLFISAACSQLKTRTITCELIISSNAANITTGVFLKNTNGQKLLFGGMTTGIPLVVFKQQPIRNSTEKNNNILGIIILKLSSDHVGYPGKVAVCTVSRLCKLGNTCRSGRSVIRSAWKISLSTYGRSTKDFVLCTAEIDRLDTKLVNIEIKTNIG